MHIAAHDHDPRFHPILPLCRPIHLGDEEERGEGRGEVVDLDSLFLAVGSDFARVPDGEGGVHDEDIESVFVFEAVGEGDD